MIEEYRNFIDRQISWECFSSTTKNKNVALLYDANTIFYIKVPMHPDSANRDVSRYSKFPEEQKVLLVSQTIFYVRRIEWDEEFKKTIIHLDVTDHTFRFNRRKCLFAGLRNGPDSFIDRNPMNFDVIEADSSDDDDET